MPGCLWLVSASLESDAQPGARSQEPASNPSQSLSTRRAEKFHVVSLDAHCAQPKDARQESQSVAREEVQQPGWPLTEILCDSSRPAMPTINHLSIILPAYLKFAMLWDQTPESACIMPWHDPSSIDCEHARVSGCGAGTHERRTRTWRESCSRRFFGSRGETFHAVSVSHPRRN